MTFTEKIKLLLKDLSTERVTRHGETEERVIVKCNPDSPLYPVIRDLHDGRLPHDFIFATVKGALQCLAGYELRSFGSKIEVFRVVHAKSKEEYTLKFSDIKDSDGILHQVQARNKDGNVVGTALFIPQQSIDLKSNVLVPYRVEVDQHHRRKGLASAMYSAAEKNWKKKIERNNAQDQDGKKFWSQPNRPFGEAKARKKVSEGARGDWAKEGYEIKLLPLDRGSSHPSDNGYADPGDTHGYRFSVIKNGDEVGYGLSSWAEVSDGLVDVYRSDLIAWAKDFSEHIDDAQAEGLIGPDADFETRMRVGQFKHIESIVMRLAEAIDDMDLEETQEVES